jgi:hypothetical protein
MKQTLIIVLGCGLAGLLAACGGASEPAPAAPAAPAADPEPQAEPEPEPEAEPEAAAETEAETEGESEAEGEPAPAEGAYQGKGKEKTVLGTDAGAKGVTHFDHWKHQQVGVKCGSCHHKGAGLKSCGKGADCHQFKEVNAPSAKDAYHKSCMPCHKKKGLSTGCDYCHQPKQG